MTTASRNDDVVSLLRQVIDPELGINIVDLGLVLDVIVDEDEVNVTIAMTSPTCPVGPYMRDEVAGLLKIQPWVQSVQVHLDREFRWTPTRLTDAGRRALDLPHEKPEDVPAATPVSVIAAERMPFLVLGALALVTGLLGGLARIGWAVPPATTDWGALHGPLMVCGFLGVLITLERAVGVEKPLAYLVPALAGAGVLAGLIPLFRPVAAGLFLGAAWGMVVIYAYALRGRASLSTTIELLGALCWVAGIGVWFSGRPIYMAVPWWALFLVLTIAGERLELNEFLSVGAGRRRVFLILVGGLLLGGVLSAAGFAKASWLLGTSLSATAVWLLFFDVARRRLRAEPLARFIAICLLSGYVWLCVSGVLLMAYSMPAAGPIYDAIWHSLFMGFVFGMIFAHAPIVFPAVLRIPIPMKARFYLHWILLQISLVFRLWGDLGADPELRRQGGLLGAIAIVLFLINTASAAAGEYRRRRSV